MAETTGNAAELLVVDKIASPEPMSMTEAVVDSGEIVELVVSSPAVDEVASG